jgi:hypothetical protein
MKKSIIATIAIAIFLVVSLGVVGIGSGGFKNWDTDTWFEKSDVPNNNVAEDLGDMEFTPENTEMMMLSVSQPILLAAPNGGYTKTVLLTATVRPDDVPDKSVDWHIDWADEGVNETLADYVTITPTLDGALTANVTCYQSFNHDVVVTVVTRVGGMSATCMVTYVGAPESVVINGNGIAPTGHSGIGSYYALPTGSTYTFDLSGANGFNDVRAAMSFTFSVSAEGSIITQDRKYNGNTMTNTWMDGTESSVAIKDITKVSNYIPNAYECSLTGSTLSIKSNSTLTGYYSASQRSGQIVIYSDSFKSFADDNWITT